VTPEDQRRAHGNPRLKLRRENVVFIILAAAVIGIVIFVVLAVTTSVDRRSYVAKNMELLGGLPRYPGSRLVDVQQRPEKANEWTFANPTVGYTSIQVFTVRRGISAMTILTFYERAITPHWRLTNRYAWAGQSNFRQGNAYLEVTAIPGEIEVHLDHDFY
jgi:hypothetical protein